MELDELKADFVLYLFAIKQAFEGGEFSDADCEVLNALFGQGLLYQSILGNEIICDAFTGESIVEFGELIEEGLPPPVIGDGAALGMTLVKGLTREGGRGQEVGSLMVLGKKAEDIFKIIIVDLMTLFQLSILDLSAKLKSENSLSADDVDNTNYVIGMVEITSINLNSTISHMSDYRDDGFGKIQKFYSDVVGFAGSLKASGLGMIA